MTTPSEPYGDEDRTLMWNLLDVWAKATKHRGSQVERDIRTQFEPLQQHIFTQVMRRAEHPVCLHSKGWLVGEELTNEVGTIPVITFRASGTHAQVREAAFHVALMSLVDGNMVAEGWRFEQAEEISENGQIAAHPFAHAQAIIGWDRGINCLIHPPHGDGENCDGMNDVDDESLKFERARAQKSTLVQHPAFPLGVKSLSGLALAVFTSLYGAPKAREVFGSKRDVMAAEGDLREDFSRLCIL